MRSLIPLMLLLSATLTNAEGSDKDEHVLKVSTPRGKISIDELSKQKYAERQIYELKHTVRNPKLERLQETVSDTNEKCGGLFVKTRNIIYSPNYPNPYPKNTICTYTFQNNNGRNCDYYFEFIDFSLENSDGCHKDRLVIVDNEALCGNTVGVKSYHTKTNLLHAKFVSDDNVENKGFKIIVTQVSCTEKTTTTTTEDSVYENTITTVTTRSVKTSKEDDDVNKNVSFIYPGPTDVEIKPAVPVHTTSTQSSITVDARGQRQFDHVPPYPNQPSFPTNPTNPEIIPFPPIIPGPINPIPPIYPIPPINPIPPVYPPVPPIYPPVPPVNPPFPNLPDCCRNQFSDRHFLLSSPGFPRSSLQRGDCLYRIFRAGPNICRLRIKFRYFWSGVHDQRLGCTRGFLEVDGRKICGCRSGLQYELQWGNGPVIMRFRNEGIPDLFYNGFVLEVTQMECPYRYLKDDIKINKAFEANNTEQLHEFEDMSNRITWPKKRSVDLLAQNVSFDFDDSDFGLPSFDPKPIKINNNNNTHNSIPTTNGTKAKRSEGTSVEYYFFDSPWVDNDAEELQPRHHDAEDVTSKFLLPNGFNDGICRLWGLKQWLALSAESLWQQRPICLPTDDNRVCQIQYAMWGVFQSPNFPNLYPGNLDVCYRFIYRPGFNRVQLWFIEFSVEDSPNCSRDKLLIGNQAYCGHALQNRRITLTPFGDRFPDIRFITDSYNSQIGFRVQYQYFN